MSNLLFICSKNQWRSPTAELLFSKHTIHQARSAGTSNKARVKVNQQMLAWADVVFVMETKHRDIITQRFEIDKQKITVLEIEDNYQYNDTELVELLSVMLYEYLA